MGVYTDAYIRVRVHAASRVFPSADLLGFLHPFGPASRASVDLVAVIIVGFLQILRYGGWDRCIYDPPSLSLCV